MKEKIYKSLQDGVQAIEQLALAENIAFIEKLSMRIADCLIKKKKVLIAGNGGSLCDAMHFAEELTGFFRKKRKALCAIALADSAHITCVGNDLGFEQIFARGIEALGQEGDLFIVLSTSGNSPNIFLAAKRAKELGLHTAAFLGKDGGITKGVCDEEMIIRGFLTSDRIQEAHMTALHIVIEVMEELLFWQEPFRKADVLTAVGV